MTVTYETCQRAVHNAIAAETPSSTIITPAQLERIRRRATDEVMRIAEKGFIPLTLDKMLVLHAVVDGIIGLQAHPGPIAPWRRDLKPLISNEEPSR